MYNHLTVIDKINPPKLLVLGYFIDDKVVNFVVDKLLYDKLTCSVGKGKHNITTSSNKMDLFLAVFLSAGYSQFPCRKTYWENFTDAINMEMSNATSRDCLLRSNYQFFI